MKALLVQIREDNGVKQEELESFAKFAGLNVSSFQVLDVFETPSFDKSVLEGIDLLFVGGASAASVSEPEKYPFVNSIKSLMLEAALASVPTFASCFGFQAAVLAFGGDIIKDTTDFEMGTYSISLTEKAKDDPVFKGINDGFYAVSVHQEKAIKLPEVCVLLAYTDKCCHAFKVKDKPFWAFQFHPELDRKTLEERLNVYKEKYTDDLEHFEAIISNLHETPESNMLVKNFVKANL